MVSQSPSQLSAEGSHDNKSSRRYEYESLDYAWDGIRLLELHAGNLDDDIRCSIRLTRLSDSPDEYEAISYVWGDASVTEPIECDGKHLDITVSLADALRHLRHQDSSRMLYADAICIDQLNLDERGQQVGIMAEVFHTSRSVIIWLGADANQNGLMALDSMRNYAEYGRREWTKSRAVGTSKPELLPFEQYDLSPPDSTVLAAISDLLDHPWFSRVWILQEAAVARKAVFVRGVAALLIEDLMLFISGVGSVSSSRNEIFYQAQDILNTFNSIWAVYQTPNTWLDLVPFRPVAISRFRYNISMLLFQTAWRPITDPRDYVYAMSRHPAMQTKNHTALVQPNYNITFDELRYQLTCACLLEKHDFSILSMVQHTSRNSLMNLPTWVPSLSLPNYMIDFGCFSAGTYLTPGNIEVNGKELVCSSHVLGLISSTPGVFPSDPEMRSNKGVLKFLQNLAHHLRHIHPQQEQMDLYGGLSKLEFLALLGCSVTTFGEEHPDVARKMLRSYAVDLRILLTSKANELFDSPDEEAPTPYPSNPVEELSESEVSRVCSMLNTFCGRRLFRLSNGYYGLGPATLQDADVCCIIRGANVPYLLRPRDGTSTSYVFLGECNVPGIMWGEISSWLERGEAQAQTIRIH